MPRFENKLELIRKSINKALKSSSKRNADLWFPDRDFVDSKRDDFYDAILHGSRAKFKNNRRLKQINSNAPNK